MTDFISQGAASRAKRQAAETRFQWLGRFAIIFSLGFLVLMVGAILWQGKGVLLQSQIELELDFSPALVDPQDLENLSYNKLLNNALKERFPDVSKRKDQRKLRSLLSPDASLNLKNALLEDAQRQEPKLLGKRATLWFLSSDDVDIFAKGQVDEALPEKKRQLDDQTIGWVKDLQNADQIERKFNVQFFTSGDSREPELAGILSALMGSILSLLVCFLLAFPIGILAAIYLEEFAPKNRLSDIIEVNINNLAAVPSIVFGLLGLSILLNTFGLPRSTPLVGGMVLALMTLPTIVIASRAALRSVPPSIREAALGMGASRVQTTFHHVTPLAMPGMLTGTIVGMAQALGETAPLLMIGMVAFIVDIPGSFVEPATALPVQIFLWADSPERAFLEKTSAAIIVLLMFLAIMNIAAIILRRKFEVKY